MRTRRSVRFLTRLAAGAVLAAAFLPIAPAGAQQERLAIRGTSVTLTPPPGFTPARSGRGIENSATGSSIMISETSAQSYAELAQRFSSAKALSEGYAQQKVTIRSVRRVDGKFPFAVGRQATNSGREVTKYYGLVQGDKTVLLTFTVGNGGGLTEADAEAVLRSIEIAPEPTLEAKLAELPFTFSAVEPYAVDDVIPRQAVTLEVAGDQTQPVVIIGHGRSQALMGDEARVAVELLRNTGGLREAQITAQGPAPFAGGAGYALTAVIENRTVVQYLRIVPGGVYLRLLARGETAAMQRAESVIGQIASTVELR
jgi:hypothetical protein